MKRLPSFLLLSTSLILACGSRPTTVPEINVKTGATAVQITAASDDSSSTGDDTDTTGADQSIKVDVPADGKAPAVNVTVTREDRKPDTK
jgi:hypothetical protein